MRNNEELGQEVRIGKRIALGGVWKNLIAQRGWEGLSRGLKAPQHISCLRVLPYTVEGAEGACWFVKPRTYMSGASRTSLSNAARPWEL